MSDLLFLRKERFQFGRKFLLNGLMEFVGAKHVGEKRHVEGVVRGVRHAKLAVCLKVKCRISSRGYELGYFFAIVA